MTIPEPDDTHAPQTRPPQETDAVPTKSASDLKRQLGADYKDDLSTSLQTQNGVQKRDDGTAAPLADVSGELEARIMMLEAELARIKEAFNDSPELALGTTQRSGAKDEQSVEDGEDREYESEEPFTDEEMDEGIDEEAEDDPDDGAKSADPEPYTVRVPIDKWRYTKPFRCDDSNTGIFIGTGNCFGPEQPHLVGGDQKDEKAHDGTNTNERRAGRQEDKLSASESEYPRRLAINTHVLTISLRLVTGERIDCQLNTWVRPFRYLLVHEPKIRAFYASLCRYEVRRAAHAEKAAAQLINVTEDSRPALAASDDLAGTDDEDNSCSAKTIESTGEAAIQESEELSDHLDEEDKHVIQTLDRAGANFAEGKQGWDELMEFMDNDMSDIMSLRQSIADGSLTEIEFENLWHLFNPGDVVIAKQASHSDKWRAYKVLHVTGGRPIVDTANHSQTPSLQSLGHQEDFDQDEGEVLGFPGRVTPFVIDCFYIDFDGHKYGPRPRRFTMQEFTGKRAIENLEVFPSKFLRTEDIRATLLERGKRFVQVARQSHKQYAGPTHSDRWLRNSQSEVHCNVVVDQLMGIASIQRANPEWFMDFGGGVIKTPTQSNSRECFESYPCGKEGCYSCTDMFDDSRLDLNRRTELMERTHLLKYASSFNLTDEHFELLPLRIYGYALQDRKWYALFIDGVQDIAPNLEDAFKSLVLPPEHKKLVQALVKNQTRNVAHRSTSNIHEAVASSQDLTHMDVVAGKGKGLIILLHGVPGVGKTSTAECVAAELRRPLFPITCGDLGTDAETVEDRLEEYFSLAQKWGCVLLLDEADVFLAKRTQGDLNRNALVSVFLRALEYYAGVLMLTTNRVAQFDEAFRSRIHISLYYPRLSKESTLSIWDMNIEKAMSKGIEVDEDDIKKFAEKHWKDNSKKRGLEARRWNGRQIKNAFQAAIALANWDAHDGHDRGTTRGPRLRVEHFQDVAATSAHFDNYLAEVHEANYYALDAKRQGIRDDDAKNMDGRDYAWAREDDSSPPPFRTPHFRNGFGNGRDTRSDSPDEVSPSRRRRRRDEEDTEDDSESRTSISKKEYQKYLAMQSSQKSKKVPASARKGRRHDSDDE